MKIVSALGICLLITSGFVRESYSRLKTEKSEVPELLNQDQDLPDGTYYIKCASSGKYIDVSWSCRNDEVCKVQLWSIGNTISNNKWIIKSEGIPMIGGYTIKSVVNSNYLTAAGTNDGYNSVVEPRKAFGEYFRDRQEWKIKKSGYQNQGKSLYNIYNKGSGKYLGVGDCYDENGCRVQVWSDNEGASRRWIFVKAD